MPELSVTMEVRKVGDNASVIDIKGDVTAASVMKKRSKY